MFLGSPRNDSVSPVRAACSGRVLWSTPLPAREAHALVVTAAGHCLVASEVALTAIAEGRIVWTRPGRVGQPVARKDGSVLVGLPRRDGLVALDQMTGAELFHRADFPAGLSRPTLLPDGHIQVITVRDEESHVTLLDPDGTPRWSRVVRGAPYITVADDGRLVVIDGGLLRAFDAEGNTAWLAGRGGFIHATEDVPAEGTEDRLCTPIALGDGRILAGATIPSSADLLIFDPTSRTVVPWPNRGDVALPSDLPIAVMRLPGQEPALVLALHAYVMLVDHAGNHVFRRGLPRPAIAILVDAEGTILVAYTTSADYWDKYHDVDDLSKQCGVRAYDASGRLLFEWQAPGPVSALALGPSGEVLVVAANRLWALG
ncbi:Hypothetical protein A7982_10442 [Minicystis rosea]|nr:Hypothetical protein A7982_10442 [Minicystis rosea]